MLKHRLTGLCLAFALVAGAALAVMTTRAPEAEAGHYVVQRTDAAQPILFNFWDLRNGRKSFFQVTNTSASPQRIHIQIYDSSDPACTEFNYYDDLTPFDTHVYDLSALDRNNGAALAAPDLTGGYGMVAVTVVNANGVVQTSQTVLTGNFVIKDPAGYQYRTNSAGWDDDSAEDEHYVVNYNSIGPSTFADLVIFSVDLSNDVIVLRDVTWEVTLFDEHENPISCPLLEVSCVADLGINETVVNSQGGPSVCLGTDSVGKVRIEEFDASNIGLHVGFIGLNDGSSKGSMDAWVNTDADVSP